MFVHHISTGSANFDEFDGHLMVSLRRRPSTPARVDYCNMVLAGVLQRMQNAVPRLVSGTHNGRGLAKLFHADFHRLDVADQVRYKLAVTVDRCLHDEAPKYRQTVVSLSPTLLVVSDYAQHNVANWMYHAIDAIHSAVRRSPLLDQLCGTYFLMI